MATHPAACTPAGAEASLARADPSLITCLELHEAMQQRMERRLAAIDAEMRELEVIRIHLGVLCEHGPRRGSSVHAVKKRNNALKRDRVEAPPTVFYPLSRRVCGVPAKLLQPPLFEAGAYIRGTTANLRHASLPLSRDEQRQREVDYLFPPPLKRVQGGGAVPPAAVERLRETLTQAGLSKDDFSISSASSQQRIAGRVHPTPWDLKVLCDAVPQDQLRAVCRGEASEAGKLSASLYALVCEAAALRTAVAPKLRVRNVALLQLQHPRTQQQVNITDWTLRHCCECQDRDLGANTHVEYLKTLQSISTAPAAGALRDTLTYAVAHAQLAKTFIGGRQLACSAATLITVCGGTFAEFEANVSGLWTRLEVLPLREAVMAALRDGDAA